MTLNEIALEVKTDKSSEHHNYTESYEIEFQNLRDKKIHLLELGVGEGPSLEMWKRYFNSALIVGIDIQDLTKKHFPNLIDDRCKIEIGNQDDTTFLKAINSKYNSFDIIIDDASHLASKTIKSFVNLFPLLKTGGIYVIEDLGVFYPDSGKGSVFIDTEDGSTSISFLYTLVDMIHNDWYLEYNNLLTSMYYKMISKITFYQGMCFIHKRG